MTTVAQIIGELDTKRKEQFAILGNSAERFTKEGAERLKMAPVKYDTIYLLPIGEPFFETIYPVAQELEHRDKSAIHVGFGGTRNFSIIGATKADAAILADFNLNQQALVECLADTAKELVQQKGIGNFGPEDFVEAFSRNEKANAMLEKIPDNPKAHSKIEVSLESDLTVPESWLYTHQTDGRFDHIMKLFAQGKIATLALNVADTEGFHQLSKAVERVRKEVPDLQKAEVRSFYLSNIPYFLQREKPFGNKKDTTPANSLLKAMSNVRLLGNPYVICAKERLYNWKQSMRALCGKNSQKLGEVNINGPTEQQVDAFNATHWGGDRLGLMHVTMGGYCDTMTEWFALQKKEAELSRKHRITSIYATPASNPPQELRAEHIGSARGR